MARYSNEIKTKKTKQGLENLVNEFMAQEGFTAVNFKNENVWKKGMGLLAAPQFMKIDIQHGKVVLQAWIKYALLPGVYVGEMGITGFTGFAIKKVLRRRVEALEKQIKD